MKYTITYLPSTFNKKLRAAIVEGEPLVIPGFEQFEFFCHDPIEGDEWLGMVVITEKSTSARIANGWSFEEAYKIAVDRLSISGVEGLRGRIEAIRFMTRRFLNLELPAHLQK